MADRFDLEAIEADDALLNLLAAGGESAWEAGQHDPALKLLAGLRLAVEVEDELPVETIDDPESFLARCATLNPVTDPFARKLAARGFALGVAAVAALSVSGVAAAVTGNPLSPYEKVIEKIADGLRPETSLPKEQLDGLPAFNKSKIVKVGKDFQETAERAAGKTQKAKDDGDSIDSPEATVVLAHPPLLNRPVAQTDQQLQIETEVVPAPKPPETKPSAPATQPTTEPSGQPTDEPTTEPSAPATTEPTTEPSAPATTAPTTEPSAPATTEPTTTTPPPTDNGSTGENPSGEPSVPATVPPAVPTAAPPAVPSDGGETSTGTEVGGDPTTTPTLPSTDPKGDEPTGDVPASPGDVGANNPIGDLLQVFPTPTGAPLEEPARLEQYFGKGFTGNGKHSSGKPALGWAKSHYAKGKHSSGHYAEGRHAAVTRAHGSMAPVTIRQILGLLNTPMSDR